MLDDGIWIFKAAVLVILSRPVEHFLRNNGLGTLDRSTVILAASFET